MSLEQKLKFLKFCFEKVPSQQCGGSVGCSQCSCYTGNEKVMGIQKILEDPNSSLPLKMYAVAARCEKCGHCLKDHVWYI